MAENVPMWLDVVQVMMMVAVLACGVSTVVCGFKRVTAGYDLHMRSEWGTAMALSVYMFGVCGALLAVSYILT